jgi:hypothetical protein
MRGDDERDFCRHAFRAVRHAVKRLRRDVTPGFQNKRALTGVSQNTTFQEGQVVWDAAQAVHEDV